MSDDPDFLTVEDVHWLHDELLARHGGAAGVRDPGALDSAVAMPCAAFGGKFLHESLFAMAAAYAFHIAQNQPFLDGNKRAALAAALVFLELNGVMVVDPDGKLYGAMIDLAERRLDKAGLAALFAQLAGTS